MIKEYKYLKNSMYKFYLMLILTLISFLVFFLSSCASGRFSVQKDFVKYNIISGDDLKDRSKIPNIIKALSDENPYVVVKAIKALGDMESKEAVQHLLPKLNDKSDGIKLHTLSAFDKIKSTDEKVIKALQFTATYDESQNVRNIAGSVLKNMQYLRLTSNLGVTIQEKSIEMNEYSDIRKLTNKHLTAISNIDISGIQETAGIAINNRLHSELFKSGQFIVLERQKMQDILQEQGFQHTGCTSTECLVEMGKILNVRLMVGGSVTKVNRIHSIDLRIIDVQSGEIVSISTEDVMGDIEDVLLTGLKNSIAKLINNFRN